MRARHMDPRTERAYVGWIIRDIRYHGSRHPTEVLSRGDVRMLLGRLHGTTGLIALLLYGAGLRLFKCLVLRVKDLQLERMRALHARDRTDGGGASRYQRPLTGRRRPGPRTRRGSGCFPQLGGIVTQRRGKRAGITCMRPRCSVRCSGLFARRGSHSGRHVTRCDTRARPTCWKTTTTSGRFRKYLGTRTSVQR